MILIADSGATKTEWGCVSRDGQTRIGFVSQGYNPNYITGTQIVADIRKNLPAELDPSLVSSTLIWPITTRIWNAGRSISRFIS